jgi:hypothetical protein
MRYDEIPPGGSGADNLDARRAEYPEYLQRIKDVFLLARNDPSCNPTGPGIVNVIHLMPSHRIVTRGAIYFRALSGQPVDITGLGSFARVLRRESPDRGGWPVTGIVYSGEFPHNVTSIDDPNNFLQAAPGPGNDDARASVDGFAFLAHSLGEDQISAEFTLPPVLGIPGEWRYKWSYEPDQPFRTGEWELLARSCRAFPVLPGNQAIKICAGVS